MRGGRWSLACLLGLLLAAGLYAAADPTVARRDADAFKVKVAEISRRGGGPPAPAGHGRTTVTESEVNGYLAVEVAGDLPSGVGSPTVSLLGQGRTTGQAVVDLDRVRTVIGATGVLNPFSS